MLVRFKFWLATIFCLYYLFLGIWIVLISMPVDLARVCNQCLLDNWWNQTACGSGSDTHTLTGSCIIRDNARETVVPRSLKYTHHWDSAVLYATMLHPDINVETFQHWSANWSFTPNEHVRLLFLLHRSLQLVGFCKSIAKRLPLAGSSVKTRLAFMLQNRLLRHEGLSQGREILFGLNWCRE